MSAYPLPVGTPPVNGFSRAGFEPALFRPEAGLLRPMLMLACYVLIVSHHDAARIGSAVHRGTELSGLRARNAGTVRSISSATALAGMTAPAATETRGAAGLTGAGEDE